MVCLAYIFTEYQYRELSQPILRQLDSLSQMNSFSSTNQSADKVTLGGHKLSMDEWSERDDLNIQDKSLINWEVILAVFSRTEDATRAIENVKK